MSTLAFDSITPVKVGDVLAQKYSVDRVLGIGGMGMVIAATHLELEQQVAIKLMLPEVMKSPQHVERFLREAKNAVKLRNEHICRVLDVGKLDNGAPFIVMEFMQGRDLAALLEARGALPVADAIDYVLQAIEGIAEAHANRIIHRDLKPQNLFVTSGSDGAPLVKVLDFGISKSSTGGSSTKTGDIMGSPSYMAPEQMMSAKDVDARADIWALGVILYQALTGKLPFDGDSLPVLCVMVLNEEPIRPTTHRADLAPALEAVILRCLDKSPQQRYPNVGALAKALVPFGNPISSSMADRISKMLSRASSPVALADVPSPPGAARDATMEAVRSSPADAITPPPDVTPSTAPAAARGPSTTLGRSAGQLVPPPVGAPRRRAMLVAAGALGVIGVGLVSWRVLAKGHSDPHTARAEATARAPSDAASNIVAAPDALPASQAKDPADGMSDRARDVFVGFLRWSATHAGAKCPTTAELVAFLGDTKALDDPWQHPMTITCSDQPADQMIGLVSAGRDGALHTDDDIESWSLGRDVTALVRGPRWVATAASTMSSRTTATARTTHPVSSTTHAAQRSGSAGSASSTSQGSSQASSGGSAAGPPPPDPTLDRGGIPRKR